MIHQFRTIRSRTGFHEYSNWCRDNMDKIDRTSTIEEIVEKYPQLIGPLREHGIVCIRCGEPIWGTLEEIAAEKNVRDIDALVEFLNQIIDPHP